MKINIQEARPQVELLCHTPAPEATIALAAKLCYSDAGLQELKAGVDAGDTQKFIRMLIKLGHESPMEHAAFTFGVEGVSRALLAQITRHRIASFSVKSQRYVGLKDSFSFIVPPAIKALGPDAAERFRTQMATMAEWYAEWQAQLGEGEKSNEDARFVLPNAAETKIVFTMNARELRHFFSLRCCNRAQWEIRAVAWRMLECVRAVAPVLFETAGPGCQFGTCSEGKMTCGKPYKRDV